jgi:hypothetical protein
MLTLEIRQSRQPKSERMDQWRSKIPSAVSG